ncbi:16S rRNA (guanine(527)-N(7))-methyltransferase RsmG [Altererythrobacter sp. MF3-039]|uniref:16S rRNA (guanine(527)-N(7))-methyltransferase RsmG n=1 Tax=Altererythrobacter sp. MF3-039 TaxID=3252901 RepID=UPI00390C6A01
MEKVESYLAALREENTHQNLVSARSLEQAWIRHLADSAQLLDHVPRETLTWLDLGTGPGLPGIILACMRPNFRFILVESRRRRVDWLHDVAQAVGLANVQIEGSRLELVSDCKVDVITARAFAPLPKLIDLSARFSTDATYWVLPKGRSAAQELHELPRSARKMFHVEQSVTDPEAGILVGKLSKSERM